MKSAALTGDKGRTALSGTAMRPAGSAAVVRPKPWEAEDEPGAVNALGFFRAAAGDQLVDSRRPWVTGSPAVRHAWKPPTRSVARCRPNWCRDAAARLEA